MTPEKLAEAKKFAALQFSPAECEFGLGLAPGTIENDEKVLAEYLQARIQAQALARSVQFNAMKGGDAAAADKFLHLGDGLTMEVVPDEMPAKKRKRGKPTA